MQTILSYITWDVNPDIFVIPGLDHPVRWYGLAWAVGLLLSQLMMTHIYKREGRPQSEVDTMTLYIVTGTLVGARLGHILFYDPVYYFHHPLRIFAVWEGGLASHGGLIGILIAAYLFARKTHVAYFWFLDRLLIVAALTGCFIRVGNFMNSEIVGTPSTLPWATVFTRVDALPRHPSQLYEALFCLILFVLAYYGWRRWRGTMQNGLFLGSFLVLLFGERYLDEMLKINQVSFEGEMMLNMGQILSIPFIVIGAVILVRAWLQSRKASLANPPHETQ